MKSPEEIACRLADDFWANADKCTHDYCVKAIAKAIRDAKDAERNRVMSYLAQEVARVADEVRKRFGS